MRSYRFQGNGRARVPGIPTDHVACCLAVVLLPCCCLYIMASPNNASDKTVSQFSLSKEDRSKMAVFIDHPLGLKAFESRSIYVIYHIQVLCLSKI